MAIDSNSQGIEVLPPDDGGSSPEPSRPGGISIWRILGMLLSLGLLVYLISSQGWNEIIRVLGSMPAHYFWISLALMMGSRICVSLRWFTLLRSAGIKMSLWEALRLTFMGLFASNFLPTTVGGDLVRMAGALYLKVDPGVGAASLVVDRLVGMTGMASLAPFGLAIILRPAAQPVTLSSPQLALLPALARLPGAAWVYNKVEKFVRSLLRSSIYWLRHPLSLVLALLCTYGHMIFQSFIIELLLQGMGQPLSFWWISALWSLNYFVTTFLPVSINGLGLQELTITSLYVKFGGVSMEAGLALAVIWRLITTLASLPGAIFLPEILRLIPGKRNNAKTRAGQEIP